MSTTRGRETVRGTFHSFYVCQRRKYLECQISPSFFHMAFLLKFYTIPDTYFDCSSSVFLLLCRLFGNTLLLDFEFPTHFSSCFSRGLSPLPHTCRGLRPLPCRAGARRSGPSHLVSLALLSMTNPTRVGVRCLPEGFTPTLVFP